MYCILSDYGCGSIQRSSSKQHSQHLFYAAAGMYLHFSLTRIMNHLLSGKSPSCLALGCVELLWLHCSIKVVGCFAVLLLTLPSLILAWCYSQSPELRKRVVAPSRVQQGEPMGSLLFLLLS